MTAVDLDALDRLRGRLIAALPGFHPWGEVVDVLLPVVDRIANERAAAELRAAARDIRYTTVLGHIAERLDVRADALDPT